MTAPGLIVLASSFGARKTTDRLVEAVTEAGMAILARIDHALAAAKAGLELRPTEVLIFGNAHGGTPLMQAVQTIGIDLPLRALAWQDEEGRTWLAYNDPGWLAQRHGLDPNTDRVVARMTEVLAAVGQRATRLIEGEA